ncbi:MAG: hypothetical protein QXG39_06305 [Candidatus Aenigmatarchaeota archaeon]
MVEQPPVQTPLKLQPTHLEPSCDAKLTWTHTSLENRRVHLQKVKHLNILQRHFIYTIYSAYIKYEDPLSTLIYAWQERGKSTVALSIKSLGLLIEDDITAYGLSRTLNELHTQDKLKDFHHLLIPDLEKVSSRTRTVRNELRSFLQTLMWDGVQKIDTYNIHLNLPFRYKMGIIVGVTPDVLHGKSPFRRLGFLSRLIPFSFDYDKDAMEEILHFIGTIQENKLRLETITIPKKKKIEVTIPQHYLDLLTDYAKELAHTVDSFCPYYDPHEQRLIGARAKVMLPRYLKAISLSNGRTVVNEEDWCEFEKMFRYFNFDMKKISPYGGW